MPRIRTSRERRSEQFEVTKVIIAPEGISTEVDYFNGIVTYFKEYKGHVSKRFEQLIDVIKRGEFETEETDAQFAIGSSSPDAVVSYATSYIDKYHPEFDKDKDKVFIIIDKDGWEDKKLSNALSLCKQKNYQLIISNPAFELWLLLHFVDVSSLSHDKILAIKNNEKETPKSQEAYLKVLLKSHIDGFSYTNLNADDFLPNTSIALVNAKRLDTPETGWEGGPFTQMPIVIESLPSIK
ncbi:TPA: RloB domain-containing protein [Vibrio vulnificus]|nr:RloB domain-containing protein [Vibrio vulnificus]HDY7874425.1 RloB domain-containing protein [Vibrio vulnificus]